MVLERQGKRILARLGALLLVFALLPVFLLSSGAEETEEPVCYEHGDVNTDGKVNSRDAVYTLYYSMFGSDSGYEVYQDCDFNHDGVIDREDAVYVLYSTFGIFDEQYPLEGTIHGYYEPEWTWYEDGTAHASFLCSCGQTEVLDADVEILSSTELSCTSNAVTEYAASVVFMDEEYTSARTVTVNTEGHSMQGVRSCTESSYCENCGYTLEAFGHEWILDAERSTEATCQEQAVQVYVCSCGEENVVTLDGVAEHTFVYSEDRVVEDPEVNPIGSVCVLQKVFTCSCGAEELGEVYEQHVYKSALTQEATCTRTGQKTFTCETCAASYTEDVETIWDAHTWEFSMEMDGISEYRCAECGETKAVVTTANEEAVSTELLAQAGNTLQLEEVSLELDTDSLSALGDSVAVSVTTADVSDILDEQTLAQIGSNPVYDFSMVTTYVDAETSEETAQEVSSFGGEITISLPYILEAEDDPECIDVWFIADDGTVECVQGTYANGYVKFTTNHFSYYTVTRLTPAQRCEQYGHNMVTNYREATCTTEGYEKEFCLRCGDKPVDNVLPKLDHDFEESGEAPTCTEPGSLVKQCRLCLQQIGGIVPALGHKWELDTEASEEPDCYHAGEHIYVCHNGCGQSYREELPQLNHDMQLVDEKKNGCSGKGYQLFACSRCGYEEKINETAPHGHYYDPNDAIVEWNEDYSSATVTLICSHDKSTVSAHTRVRQAVVSHEIQEGTCQSGGYVIHKAEVSYNKQDFVFTVEEELPQGDHSTGDWEYSSREHYKICTSCGEELYNGAHDWTNEVITQQPTCNTNGSATVSCSVCHYEKEKTLMPTGQHIFVNGKCVDCGYEEGTCNHVARYEVPLDFSSYDICKGINVAWLRCDCGEKKELAVKGFSCFMGTRNVEMTTDEGIPYTMEVNTCNNCGLVFEFCGSYPVLDKDTCDVQHHRYQRFTLAGDVILETSSVSNVRDEHVVVPAGSVNLSSFGLCGGTVQTSRCYCGEHTRVSFEQEQCDWSLDTSRSTQNMSVEVCGICGAERITTASEDEAEELCLGKFLNTYTYTMGGKEVYTAEESALFIQHNYLPVSHIMAGEDCRDGVMVSYACEHCGKTTEEYYGNHVGAYVQEIPLEGSCADVMYLYTCPCGQERRYNPPAECSFSWSQDPDTGDEKYVCSVCGLTLDVHTEKSAKDDNCYIYASGTVTIRGADGKVQQVLDIRWNWQDHNEQQRFELLEEKCTDGVDIVIYCPDCETEFNRFTQYQHVREQEPMGLEGYGICGGDLYMSRCPCGDFVGYGYDGGYGSACQWDYPEQGMRREVRVCRKCGVKLTFNRSEPDMVPGEPCAGWQDVVLTVTKDGQDIHTVSFTTQVGHHTNVNSKLTLLPGAVDCTDGYTVEQNCLDCGYVWQPWTAYGHNNYRTGVETISEGALCGTLLMEHGGCACGKERWSNERWIGGKCTFNYEDEYYLQGENAWACECSQCGAVRVRTWEERDLDDEDPCHFTVYETYSIRRDGKELCRYDRTVQESSHQECVWSFRMLGTTCEEGYYVTGVCHTCGEVVVNNNLQTACQYWRTGREVIFTAEEDGVCSDVICYENTSPCGEKVSKWMRSGCRFSYDEQDADGNSVSRCSECGLKRTTIHMGEVTDGCNHYDANRYICEINGKTAEFVTRNYWTSHQMVPTFELQGDSCEDGYTVSWNCQKCDYGYPGAGINVEHSYYPVEEHNLDNNYCSGSVTHYSCACGEVGYWDYWDNCSWKATGETDSNGLKEYRCADCGNYRYYENTGKLNTQTCTREGTFSLRVIRNGKTLVDISDAYTKRVNQHTMKLDTWTYRDEEKGCLGGGTYIRKCIYCDATEQSGWGAGFHPTILVEEVNLPDLSQNACGGRIWVYTCPCGEDERVQWDLDCNYDVDSWDEISADGIEHRIDAYSCGNCGVILKNDSYYADDLDNCQRIRYSTYTLSFEGVAVKSWDVQSAEMVHDYRLSNRYLMEDAETCDDGVVSVYQCTRCEESTREHDYWHITGVTESIDLETYGAICGSTLDRHECVCGKISRYDISNQFCDMDEVEIPDFIDSDINNSQVTGNGYQGYWTYCYMLTCSVTDPEPCGLKIRMSEYWVHEDNCTAVEYQLWQLGYDEETDTWQREIKIPTGERKAYHGGQHYVDEERDGKWVSGWAYECPDCGSYGSDLYYNAEGYWKNEEYAVNTLDNGENKEYRYITEEDFYYKGYTIITLNRAEYTYADGSSYWYQYEYTYETGDDCCRHEVYTNSDGDYEEDVREHGHIVSSWVTLKDATCSQFGREEEREYCLFCGEVLDVYDVNTYEPNCHNWEYNDGKGTYECMWCGLENVNGASGQIVMEDLTYTHGNNENYVVGYWNRGGIEVQPKISVILNDREDDQEQMLTGIDLTALYAQEDGITAYVFSKAQAIDAAKQTMEYLGYSGSYAIRFNFVPPTGETTLDYAITFDSLTA